MAAGLDLRVLEAFDEALDWPEAERATRLAAIEADDPALSSRLRALLASEAAGSRALPTEPPEPVGPIEEPPPPERIGVWRLAGLLGEGGMGTVWHGERDDGLFEQAVAIKLVRPGLYAASALAQFALERRLLARLRHPNIASLHDGGTDPEGRAYFVMELVAGLPLTEHVRSRGLGLREAVALLGPVCAAVQHAHQGLVVHADLKPGNILVDHEGRPKLLDFGIARGLGEGDASSAGHGLTPAYASPQRRAGEPPVPADDLYALGVILHELVAGSVPDGSPLVRDAHGRPVDAELAAVVARATAADPARRHESAAALAADLEAWAGRRPVSALPRSWPRLARLLVRRRPWGVASASAALAGLVAALAVISWLYLRAEAERAEAELRFGEARDLSHFMLFDLFHRIADAPGTMGLRRDLVGMVQADLHALAASPHASPDVLADAAIAAQQVAGLDALFAGGQEGRRPEAMALLDQSAALLDPSRRGRVPTPRWLYAAGRLKLFRGFLLYDTDRSGRTALALLRTSVAELAGAAARLPDDPEVAADLWKARLALADVLGAGHDNLGEVALVREAVAAYAANPALLNRSDTTPLLVARSYTLIGQAQEAGGNHETAVRAFRLAEAALVAEEAAHPSRARTLKELLDVRWNLGVTLEALGRHDEALAALDAALASGRGRLAVDAGDEGLQRQLDLIGLARAGVLGALGRHGEAAAAAGESLAGRARRHAARPDDPLAWREYLAALRPVGDLLAAAGDRAGACARYREADGGRQAYASRFPDLPPPPAAARPGCPAR